jgi:hypothetical protein
MRRSAAGGTQMPVGLFGEARNTRSAPLSMAAMTPSSAASSNAKPRLSSSGTRVTAAFVRTSARS